MITITATGIGDNAKCYRELHGSENWEQVIVFASWESLVTLD